MGKRKSQDSDPETYHVEVITKARVVMLPIPSEDEPEDDSDFGESVSAIGKKKRGRKKKKTKKGAVKAEWEYYVKWAGYDEDANSWEPSTNVAGCQRLLASFWNHVGMDNSDYPVGYIVEASEKWIKKEKKFFAREFNSAQEEMRRKKMEELYSQRTEKSVTKKAKRRESNAENWVPVASSSKVQVESDEDTDDVPLMIKVPPKRKRSPGSSTDDGMPFKVSQLPRKAARTDASGTSVSKGKQRAVEPQSSPSSPTSLFSSHSSPEIIPLSPVAPTAPPKKRPLPLTLQPAKPTPTLPVPRRPANPHLLPSASAACSSTLSTKQRLSQGALALAPIASAKVPIPRMRPPPATAPAGKAASSASDSLKNLGFKKKPAAPVLPGPSQQQHSPDLTLAELNAPAASAPSPAVSFTDMFTPQPTISSPQVFEEQEPNFDPFVANGTISPEVLHHTQGNVIMTQAENFLQSIMPSALSGPMVPVIEQPYEPPLPRSLQPAKPLFPTRILKKKWTWTGEITMDVVGGKTESLCYATLSDLTDAVPTGLRFNIAMTSMHQLHFLSFHDAIDMDALLGACRPAQQLARLGPREDNDVAPLTTLVQYMGKREKVILVPVSLDDNIIGHILLFPHTNSDLCKRFHVPSELQVAGSLVAAIAPWAALSAHLARESRKLPSTYLPASTDLAPMLTDKARWERTLRMRPLYHHALRVLQFPRWLHRFMAEEENDRAFCIWWDGGDGTRKEAGLETKLLFTIMEQCRAKNAGHKADVRVVFVHVGALGTLHRLPALVERRAKTPHVQFYTYGTHESVPPQDWGTREIYPCGGVVTFTPNALIDDPIEVLKKINQIDQHPLWACYILPSVLGMTAKLVTKERDPLELFDRDEFPYLDFLRAIEAGEVALIRAPPHDRSPLATKDLRHEWIRDHWVLHPQDARGILEAGVSAFSRAYSNVQEAEWGERMEKEMTADLASMQRHRAIMDQYRRYVVVRSERDADPVPGSRDALEWTTVAKFDFKDDFYSNKA